MLKVLFISNIEWCDENAFGNTVSNLFCGIDTFQYASLYTRSSMPSNSVCTLYYSLSTGSIVRNYFKKEKIGVRFQINLGEKKKSNAGKGERALIRIIHKFNLGFIKTIDEYFFCTNRWRNQKLQSFIQEFSPDIVFSFLTDSRKEDRLISFVKQIYPNVKTVGFIADDVYNNSDARGKSIIRKRISDCDLLYGASAMLCDSYKQIFEKDVTPLYKGCHFKQMIIDKKENPIEIVYAGNLYYGRDDTLAQVIKSICRYNASHEQKFHLNIYSGSEVKSIYKALFNDGINVTYHGQKPFATIQSALQSASIVLHVESFDAQWKRIVRFSYSTKITDCLESGSVLMVIGPQGIASVEETKNIPGVIVIDDVLAIDTILSTIDSSFLKTCAKMTRDYAERYRSIEAIQRQLFDDFTQICGVKQ